VELDTRCGLSRLQWEDCEHEQREQKLSCRSRYSFPRSRQPAGAGMPR
jgi:hypothetical protein